MSKPNQHNIERLNWKIIIEKKDQNVKKKEHSKKINNKKGQKKKEKHCFNPQHFVCGGTMFAHTLRFFVAVNAI